MLDFGKTKRKYIKHLESELELHKKWLEEERLKNLELLEKIDKLNKHVLTLNGLINSQKEQIKEYDKEIKGVAKKEIDNKNKWLRGFYGEEYKGDSK